jgi:hypothetical protein
MVGNFWQPYVGQAVGDELDLLAMIGGAEERARSSIPTRRQLLALYRASKKSNYYILTLKMATEMSAKTLDNFQHSTPLIPESRSYTLNSSRENLRTRISHKIVMMYT